MCIVFYTTKVGIWLYTMNHCFQQLQAQSKTRTITPQWASLFSCTNHVDEFPSVCDSQREFPHTHTQISRPLENGDYDQQVRFYHIMRRIVCRRARESLLCDDLCDHSWPCCSWWESAIMCVPDVIRSY